MSADRWSICPACKKKAEADKAAAHRKVADTYGKITPEEYQRMFRQADAPIKLEETLREDYEIGTHGDGDSEFKIDYRCSCDCGFSFSYKHSVDDMLAERETTK